MKRRHPIHFYILLPMVAVWYLVFSESLLALGRDSIIDSIDKSLQSIVQIKARNAVAGKGPASVVKDADTGRILIMQKGRAATFERMGAGAIIHASGLIITNEHIVKDAGRIAVILHDKSAFEAKVVHTVTRDDIAFIRIAPVGPLPAVTFSDSDRIKLGGTVYSVGNSPILDGTISQGVILGIGKRAVSKAKKRNFIDLIKTDIKLYEGDSGGPLLDEKGGLLGLIVASETSHPYATFAIPSNKIKGYYLELLNAINEKK